MEADDISQKKQSIFQDGEAQICQNTSTGSLQNHSQEKLKNKHCDNSQQCLKVVKKQRVKNWIENKNKNDKKTAKNRTNEFNLKQKKQNDFLIYEHQLCTQQIQNEAQGNGKKNKAPGHQKQDDLNELNQWISNPYRNQKYNNQQSGEKLISYENQKCKLKNQKILIHSSSEKSSQKQILQLKQDQSLMFLKGSNVVCPIPDNIFGINGLNKNQTDVWNCLKPHNLPKGFCFLMEMLNLSYLFPEVFGFEEETISKMVEILQAPIQLQIRLNKLLEDKFRNFLKMLCEFIIQDLNTDKLSIISDKDSNNILNLAKFCQENELIEFVFKYNWPLILRSLTKLSTENQKEENSLFQKSISLIKNQISSQSYQIPQDFELRFELISFLIDSYSKTNYFRQVFNKTVESNRNVNKKKSQLQQQKKLVQQKLKKLYNNKDKKTKRIIKKDKSKRKQSKEESEGLFEKESYSDQQSATEKLQREIDEIQQEIQKENRQDSLSCCHFLGKDHYGSLYWYVSYFPDKLFIEKMDSSWSYLQIDQINHFIECLNRNAMNENRLHQKIQQYYQSAIHKRLSKMQIETEVNNVQNPLKNHNKLSSTIQQKKISSFCQNMEIELQNEVQQQNQENHESSKNSIQNSELLTGLVAFKIDQDSLCRMIEVGEKKMTQYLKDRNSRWGSEENKQLLLETVRGSGPHWLEESKKQISLFNEKICVVEIQYKVFVQQSVQQVDSKIKKIQTKIWGINEKFKHNWYDFISTCSSFSQLFFAVSVLYSLIKKYTSKHRKLRKQYEQIKQKPSWKTTPANKDWKQSWNEHCEVCGASGQVLCCDFCPKVYHLQCVNMTCIPKQQFKCKSCKQQITTRNQLKNIASQGRRKDRK